MRTAIYVYSSSTVSIRAHEDDRGELLLRPYNQGIPPRSAVGTMTLAAGIYLVASERELQLEGGDVSVEATPATKDIWPVPKARALALEPGATVASVQQFFRNLKSIGD